MMHRRTFLSLLSALLPTWLVAKKVAPPVSRIVNGWEITEELQPWRMAGWPDLNCRLSDGMIYARVGDTEWRRIGNSDEWDVRYLVDGEWRAVFLEEPSADIASPS